MPAFTKMLTCQFNVPLSYALQIWRIPCVHLSQLDVESDINLAYYKGSMTVLEFKYGHPCCELEKKKTYFKGGTLVSFERGMQSYPARRPTSLPYFSKCTHRIQIIFSQDIHKTLTL